MSSPVSLLTSVFINAVDLATRRALVSQVFVGSFESGAAYVPLVKRLQESLGRLEGFEVLTAVASTPDGQPSFFVMIYLGHLFIETILMV